MLTLEEEKRKLIDGKENNTEKLINRFMMSIDNHDWLYIPCITGDKGIRLIIDDHYGKKYIAIYSSNKSKKVAKDMISTDINKVIDTLFADGNVSGVVIDMNDNPIYVERGQINRYSSRKDPRLVKREWGKGIPQYKITDIKTNEELHDFAMSVLDDYLVKNGYVIHERYNFSSWFINYIVSSKSKLYYISVEAGIAPNIPTLNKNKRVQLNNAASKQNAIPLFASVSFGSIDGDRFNKGLALCGDGFYARFTGFEEVLD